MSIQGRHNGRMASAPPRPVPAPVIEQVCRILADAVTGSEIPSLIAPFNRTPESAEEQRNTKWKRLFNAVVTVQNRIHDGRPLINLIHQVMAPARFSSQAEFDTTRALINEKLLLVGYSVRQDGKVIRERAAATVAEAQARADDLRAELTRRQVHPDVLHFCRAELLQQNYFHAVLEACKKSVSDKVRTLTGQQGDGSALIDATCTLSSGPRIVFNSLATEWERSEQTGLATLMKGLFSTFRNPTAHAPRVVWVTSRADALDMLTLASMLHRRLDDATIR